MAGMRTEPTITADSALIIHSFWCDGLFHLWGIRRDEAAAFSSDQVADAAALHEAVGELSPDSLLAEVAESSNLEAWLPAGAADTNHSSVKREKYSRVKLSTLALRPADCIDLLTSLVPARAGDSTRYWSLLAHFVEKALRAQQFVPDMYEESEGRIEARWRLAIQAPEALQWLERMVAAMPPICRAAIGGEGRCQDAVGLIDSFLAVTADAVIRRTLSNDPAFDDVHERAEPEGRWESRWISALIGNNRVMRGSVEELAPLAAEVNSWSAEMGDETEGPVPKLVLHLDEPDDYEARPGGSATWPLHVELAADEGQPLDLHALWSERDAFATILGMRWARRRAHLRAELMRAARVYPPLLKLAKQSVLSGLQLSTADAHAFLRQFAPLLIAEGIEVNLPEWSQQSERKLGLYLSLRPPSAGIGGSSLGRFGLGALLEFNWQVAIGDEHLTLEEFEAIANKKAPLVKLRGKWFSLEQQDTDRALEFVRKQAGGKMSLLSALRLAGGAEDVAGGLPILGISGEDWLEQFLRQSPQIEVEALPQPQGFCGTLRPYQLRGLGWLVFLHRLGIGACLADDMGLGKTIQLIALLLSEREQGTGDREEKKVGPTLLFAPMSVVGNWQREIQRFAPSLRVMVHHGPMRIAGDEFIDAVKQHDVMITTYGLAHRCQKDFSRMDWHRIALDEAQKIKNPSAAQTIALRGLNATHRIALTGTPVENHLSELWSIMEMLNPGLLGSASSFRARFAVPIEKLGDQDRAAQLRRLMRPFLLRRLKNDPAVACDLPEKMEMRVYCNLTSEQAAIYQRVVGELLNEVDQATGIRRRGLILASLTRLKQICNHPAHFLKAEGPLDGRSGKCERLIEMLEEVIEEGDSALVFTQYREMGDLLQPLIKARLGISAQFLHGGTTMKHREEMIDQFQNRTDTPPIFLLSLKAGGFGLNLTRANHVFHFDRWWNPAVEDQATDRVHRIGQTRVVQVHKFVCIGTVEERIDKLLTEKTALADNIVGSGDEWLTGLTTGELREYLALSDDAVVEN